MDKEFIEIPFGAYDLKRWEYTIPEGFEAEIKDGKIIVKEKESEDERIRKHIIKILDNLAPCHWNGNEKSECIAYLEKQKEPAEWSEDDLKWAEEIRIALLFYSKDKSFVEKLINWFDNHIQPKPFEWSEEDEHCIELLDTIIDSSALIPKNRIKCHSFLKSLRPSWKPSEEQMKALQNAVALTACDKELTRLYNQLKKL